MRTFIQAAQADRSGTLIALDVDGTVSEIARSPQEAFVDRETRALLRELSRDYHLWFISGRDAEATARMVGVPAAGYVGDHGLELLGRQGARPFTAPSAVRADLARLTQEVIGEVPDVAPYVERKHWGVAFHYRALAAPGLPERLRVSIEARLTPGMRLLAGKMVLEVTAGQSQNKGSALHWLIDAVHARRVLSAGDDETDVAMFRALAGRTAGDGRLRVAVLQGEETPQSLVAASDAVADGVAGLRDLLRALVR